MKLFIYLLLQVLVFMPVASFAAENILNSLVQKQKTTEATEAQKAGVIKTYGKLPLYFIKNTGQVDRKVSFYERGAGHATFFTKDGVVLSLTKSEGKAEKTLRHTAIKDFKREKSAKVTSEAVRLSFVGANEKVNIIAEDKMPGHVNYFVGNDKSKWRSNIPTYGAVTYKNVYEKIDIKFYGNNRNIEHDVIVRPGGDFSQVAFAYSGIKGLKVKENGDLEVSLKNGNIVEKRPVIYQNIKGERVALEGRFRILKDKDGAFAYGFKVASYDKTKDLIIDPVLVYSTYLGGSLNDASLDITIDTFGDTYVTGKTSSLNFPIISPIQSSAGGLDAFITKIDSAGTAIVYSTYLGGNQDDYGIAITTDASSNAYVIGQTWSIDFPVVSPLQGVHAGGLSDAFIVKIDPTGATIVYSTYLGGYGFDVGFGIAADVSGNAYVTGGTESPNFPLVSPIQALYAGGGDTYITKINPAGSALAYSTFLGGNGWDISTDIAVDAMGNAYVTGITSSINFPTSSPIQAFNAGINDAYVTKINSTGTALIYSTYLGGSAAEEGWGIAVDSVGNAYVTGGTGSTSFPLVSPIQGIYGGGGLDAYITKINPTGTALIYSTYLGGTGDDIGWGITINPAGSAYVTGRTTSTDFPLASPIQGINAGGFDSFITKINPFGSILSFSTYLGGSLNDESHDVTVDNSGNVYIAGGTKSLDFPLVSPIQGSNGGLTDVFISKIRINSPPIANAGPVQNIFLTETASLDGSASSDPDGDPIVSYTWGIDSAPAGSTAVLIGATTVTPYLTPDLPGQYIISLVVNDGKNNSLADTMSITATQNMPPIAVAEGVPTIGVAPLNVNFNASGSSDPEGGMLSYSWDFGDTTSGTGINPSHTYTIAGTFTATVTVTDNFGLTAQASIVITVPNQPPTVVPTATPLNGPAPLNVQFTANESDPDGTIQTYLWDFGDGASSTLANPLHTYTTVGSFTATVTVTDNFGLTAQASVMITVLNQPPIVAPTASPVNGLVPLDVQFTANGSDPDGNPLTYLWDFGDTTSSTLANPLHTYTSPGTFVATVSASDGDFTVTGSVTINVTLHDIMLSLSPDATSISRGSTLGYTVTATNTTATTQCFNYWENVILPNGSQYPIVGEFFGPIHICLNAGSYKSAHLTHGVPISAPVGTYTLNAYVGTHPTPIISEGHFNFNVTAFNPATKNPQRSWRLIENGFRK